MLKLFLIPAIIIAGLLIFARLIGLIHWAWWIIIGGPLAIGMVCFAGLLLGIARFSPR